MRIALITMTADTAATVRFAGHPIAWHQVQAAIALACEKVVCLADRPGPELAALQREAERRGAAFHAASHHRALSGLVSSADTLIVFAPGILPDREWLAQALSARAGVATLPAEVAVELGFERIDRDRAWAGVLATRGDAVEALTALAPDADPVSGLLRIALQRGAGAIAVPDAWLDDGRWAIIASGPRAQRYEAEWYARHVPSAGVDQPGAALAYRLARAMLKRTRSPLRDGRGLVTLGGIAALAASVIGYHGATVAALVVLTLGGLLQGVGSALGNLARAGSGDVDRRWPDEARRAALDLALIATAASPAAFGGWTAPFAAAVLVAGIRLAEQPDAPRLLRPWADRVALLAVLSGLAAAASLAPGMAIIALLALALRLFAPALRG